MNQNCRVCGEIAAGYHFGAFTCEGCKSFFGRTYNNRSSIGECKNSDQCIINKKNRTSCKSCRLKKCFSVGMSKSGSRYGRRSNWFKIHCLLQDQGIQQQQQQQHHHHHPSNEHHHPPNNQLHLNQTQTQTSVEDHVMNLSSNANNLTREMSVDGQQQQLGATSLTGDHQLSAAQLAERYAQHIQLQQQAAASLAGQQQLQTPFPLPLRDSDQTQNVYASVVAQMLAYCYLVTQRSPEQ